MPPKKKSAPSDAAVATETAPPAPAYIAKVPADAEKKGRVFLIDSYSFIFRAYHAMARQRSMSTKTGVPTSASYVFINMLRKLRDDFNPEFIAAIFDTAGPTFRDTKADEVKAVKKFDLKTQTFQEIEYKGYKANRSEMPPDLAQQVPYIRRALAAYRIPILEMPGFEADDVIGTLAKKAADSGFPVYVVSSDKDMLQLVNDRVCVLNPPKDNLICDSRKVEEILGVPPERVIDIMALRGDSIDNVPGAPGIGDKGSVDLIQKFGSLDNLLDHAADVEKKTYRESLLNNRDTILFSREMVTIDCNVPVEFHPETMRMGEPDNLALRDLFTELEMTSLLKDLVSGVDESQTEYTEAKSAADVEKVLKALPKNGLLALAIESIGAAPAPAEDEPEENEAQGQLTLAAAPVESPKVQMVAISAAPNTASSVALDSSAGERLKKALADPKVSKVVHDFKSALHAMRDRGIELQGVDDDTVLYSYLLDPTYSSHTLPEVALRRFNLKLSGALPESADITQRLASLLRDEVETNNLRQTYDSIDLPLVPVLARMEEAGVKIDCDVLAKMSKRLDQDANAVAKQIHELAGMEFNINSPKQLGDVLFNKLNLPKPVKYGKGKTISTAVDVLQELALTHDVPRLVLEYRQLTKLKSTYVDALPTLLNSCTKRLHTTFDQTNTATGRLSSKNPNLQNIPIRTELGREIRAAFIAEPGHVILSADYSQIELRLLAHFSEDPLLVEAFGRGEDIHTLTAAQVFGVPPMLINAEHRRRAKAVNFGIVYGQTPFGLAQVLGIEQKEARQFIEAYFAKYTGVRKWLDQIVEQAHHDKKVTTMFGRVRPLPDIDSRNPNLRGFAERTAMNTPLQGTAADLIKLAMIRLDSDLRERKLKSRMTLQVHDELVFEVPEDEVNEMKALVRERMEQVHPLRVPLVVEIGVGRNWRDQE
ncbi:MAG TPA: DNA polymerase I [Terriglobales bacterium]|nr:DNA polymerase I [Terriglobales bacterium]